ncbi:homeobox protein knotted-1-like 1 [Setaria italica]|uniref:homeobox protein knotted-1-like 1 n=1 Tax=Setaria italica TaxID=4555 RepID=UPI000BE60872|nr:homeobox protein knotted-1-like 1 [Setaria italica]
MAGPRWTRPTSCSTSARAGTSSPSSPRGACSQSPRRPISRRSCSTEDLYNIHPGISRVGSATSEASVTGVGGLAPPLDLTELMKAQIASHPRYPSLLSAYIECRKKRAVLPFCYYVQRDLAALAVASLLEEVSREGRATGPGSGTAEISVDPELDEFMLCSWVDEFTEISAVDFCFVSGNSRWTVVPVAVI